MSGLRVWYDLASGPLELAATVLFAYVITWLAVHGVPPAVLTRVYRAPPSDTARLSGRAGRHGLPVSPAVQPLGPLSQPGCSSLRSHSRSLSAPSSLSCN